MSSKMRVWLVGAAVLLLLSGLGCSICPLIPERSTPEPTDPPAPTPTPTPDIGDMEFFHDPRSGISLLYPEDWQYDSDGESVILAESDDALVKQRRAHLDNALGVGPRPTAGL